MLAATGEDSEYVSLPLFALGLRLHRLCLKAQLGLKRYRAAKTLQGARMVAISPARPITVQLNASSLCK